MPPPGPEELSQAVRRLRGRFAEVEGTEAVSDGGLEGFLWQARWNVDEAAVLLQRHLAWRQENLPVKRSEVEEVLQAGRVAVLDSPNADGHPVLLLNFRRLLQVDFSQERELTTHIRATVYCAEEMISRMPPGVNQWVAIINCAGIVLPPTAFLQSFTKVFRANYPERVLKIVIYPVPRMVVRFVESMMWFVPATTREKASFVDSPDILCKAAGLSMEQLPSELASPSDLRAPEVPPGSAALEVAARKKSAHCHTVSSGARVEWEMHTLEHNVILGLRFLPTSGGTSEPQEILSPVRVAGKSGVFAAEQDGVLEFSLDNSFSYMKGKSVIITVRDLAAGAPGQSSEEREEIFVVASEGQA